MNLKEALAHLESAGNDARRRYNAKAGAPANQFGAPMSAIRALARKIKADHALALQLWSTGNVDAQFLAALLLQPKSLTGARVEALVRATTFGHVADWLNAYVVAPHPDSEKLRIKWMKSKEPWTARAAWHLTAAAINKGRNDSIDPVALLDRIEKEMPRAAPHVQWTMNNTLMAIGIRHAPLRSRAISIGEKIGLYKDWPVSKGCTPPYAPVAIAALSKRAR